MTDVRDERTLKFGPATLTRSYCTRCKEETLHVRGQCNHCKGERHSSASPSGPTTAASPEIRSPSRRQRRVSNAGLRGKLRNQRTKPADCSEFADAVPAA